MVISMKILIIKLGALGDVIRTTSFIDALREKYGTGTEIFWITNPNAMRLLEGIGIDKVASQRAIPLCFSEEKFDLVINLDDDLEACRTASRIKYGRIVGAYTEKGKLDYSRDLSEWFDMGLISRFGIEKANLLKKENSKTYQQIIASALGIPYSRPKFRLTGGNVEFAKSFVEKNMIANDETIIGMNSSAGGRWKNKRLSEEKTAKLIRLFKSELGFRTILFGGPEEAERNKKIAALCGGDLIDAGCQNELDDFAALVNLCSVLVTSDSLALHFATCFSVPTVAFFGPTSSAEVELYGTGTKLVPAGECTCCYKNECTSSFVDEILDSEFVNAVRKYARVKLRLV